MGRGKSFLSSIKFSQNFLKSDQLVGSLVEESNIDSNDTVYEIGAGNGIITKELVKKAKKVVAFELDKRLFSELSQKFGGTESLELRNEDFLTSPLPNFSYKVFSNIPFSITSQIVKKLFFGENPPEASYLIIQKEAAGKFAGKPYDDKNSQVSVLLYPWFEASELYEFKPDDFFPKPSVKIVFLEIKKRAEPLVPNAKKQGFMNFVSYTFGRQKQNIVNLRSRPSDLDFKDWLELFRLFLSKSAKQQSLVEGFYKKQLKEQESLKKINRTRVDKDWKRFR